MPDLLLILIVILILAILWRGPKTLPKIGEALGRGFREARTEAAKAQAEIQARVAWRRRAVQSQRRPGALTGRGDRHRRTPRRRRHPTNCARSPERPASPGLRHRTPDRGRRTRRAIETLADLPPLRDHLLFVGLNPSPVSVQAGHYHQGRLGRTFWRRLMLAQVLPAGHAARDRGRRAAWPPATASPTC